MSIEHREGEGVNELDGRYLQTMVKIQLHVKVAGITKSRNTHRMNGLLLKAMS
jgi:hypothetical protein